MNCAAKIAINFNSYYFLQKKMSLKRKKYVFCGGKQYLTKN